MWWWIRLGLIGRVRDLIAEYPNRISEIERCVYSEAIAELTMNKILVVFASIWMVAAKGEGPPVSAPQPKPALRRPVVSFYCLPVSAGFLESESKASDEMKKCSAGDTIVVPARSAGAIARMCDFSKSIVAMGDNVICAMVLPERASR
jgi:hypothetical protein